MLDKFHKVVKAIERDRLQSSEYEQGFPASDNLNGMLS
jgi:hypothetical protein